MNSDYLLNSINKFERKHLFKSVNSLTRNNGDFGIEKGSTSFSLLKKDFGDKKNELISDRFIPLRRGDISKEFYDTCISNEPSLAEESQSSMEQELTTQKIFKNILRNNILNTNLGYDRTGDREKTYFDKNNTDKTTNSHEDSFSIKKRENFSKKKTKNETNPTTKRKKFRKINPTLHYNLKFANLDDGPLNSNIC